MYYDYGGVPYWAYSYSYDVRYRNRRDSVAFGAPTRLVPARQVVLGARWWF